MRKLTEEELSKEQFDFGDVIEGLQDLHKRNYFEIEKEPRFSLRDFNFLANLILRKEKDFITISALGYIVDTRLMGMGISNTASLRRVLFFKNFLLNRGNATKSAIAAGYSPRSAKQQGYRTLKWIQKQNKS